MSESHLRVSSPPSASPSRVSRPHWPWATYTSQTSIHSPMNPMHAGASHSSCDPRSSISSSSGAHATTMPWPSNHTTRPNTGSSMLFTPNATNETIRHWTFTAFEWVVHDVNKLMNFVEGRDLQDGPEGNVPIAQNDDFEILKESPLMGDGKFKLEIARTPLTENNSPTDEKDQVQTLSLYITSLMIDFPHEYETSASMMTAIKCQDDRVGERGARAEWIWEFWQERWKFCMDSEVWVCTLPPLSTLLDNPRIKETDSFVICVQIHCPIGPIIPQQPYQYYVPRDLLEGLEASLDNANTGDVRFICLQKLNLGLSSSPQLATNTTLPTSPVSTTSSFSQPPFSTETTARKRVIYAHSDIISRRSEYFATMIGSSFSENTHGLVQGERKIYTIIVEEADFETIYWLLKWIYGNWLLFKEHDDPRVAVDGVGEGWSARWLNARGGEWDWKTFRKTSVSDGSNTGTRDDCRSVTSAESRRSSNTGGISTGKVKPPFQASTSSISSSARPASGAKSLPSSKTTSALPGTTRQPNASAPRRSGSVTTTTPNDSALPVTSHTTKSVPVPITLSTANFPSSSHYPISPNAQRHHQHLHPSPVVSTIDPHPHPTPPPPPASALSMYQVAHRYAMPGLASLALEHIMSTITPQSSFPLLLATSVWIELRALVENFVVERWDEVSVSDEFELCCQEVAAGEWGIEGGKTLTALFRRLRPPNTASYART